MTKQYEVVKEGGVDLNDTHYDEGHVFSVGEDASEQILALIEAGDITAVEGDGSKENQPMSEENEQAAGSDGAEQSESSEANKPADESSEGSSNEGSEQSESSEGAGDAAPSNE